MQRLQICFENMRRLPPSFRLLTSSSINREPAAPGALRAAASVVNAVDFKYRPGKVYSDFTCTRAERIPDFHMTAYQFRHNGAGSNYLHIDRNDNNNAFGVSFRTTPFDSTGLPHILEHITLCGSHKFPVRDPFFKMLNRSVATFMNAMTGPDFTMYPFSTMNESDFRNLQQVYLDAVFRPNLTHLDFLQEGWRVEHTDLRDRKSPYTIKGVVYNEMKGAFSENSTVFRQQLLNSLLPDHTYGVVSGGDPLEIPKLTHEDLVAFHRKYYHPSNANFYSYGTFDLEKTLAYVNDGYLSQYQGIDNAFSRIPSQKRWTEPRHVHVSSRYDTMGAEFERQNQIAIALLMSDITDLEETFTLQILDELLRIGPNSYFYKSLIEPNFSGGYSEAVGYDPNIKDTMYTIGLQDIKVEDFSRFQETYDKTIDEAIEKGFEKDHIDSILHNQELLMKHQTASFGLNIFFPVTTIWNHGGDVISALKVSEIVNKFKENLSNDPKYLQKKVDQYFKSNKHRLTLTMTPDESYEKIFSEAEQRLIEGKITKMDDQDKKSVYENGLALEELQKAPAKYDALPTLSLEDVKNPPDFYPLQITNVHSVPTRIVTVPTNQIAYFRCFFDSSNLSPQEIHLLPLFCQIIDEMGTGRYDYRTFNKIVNSKTSGINFALQFADNLGDSSQFKLGVLMETHALDYNIEKMFELVHELLTNFKIDDPQRLEMLLENYISKLSVGITTAGHVYAAQTASGLVSEAGKLKCQLSGLEHVDAMKELAKTKSSEEIRTQLFELGRKLFDAGRLKVALNTSDDMLPRVQASYDEFVTKMPRSDCKMTSKKSGLLESKSLHYVMNIPVNYCAKSIPTVPFTHSDHPKLRVLAKLLSARYLLPVIREQNGSYGAGAQVYADGIFNFFSYRDPNSGKTLDVFDETYNWVKNNPNELTEQTLFEAKLGVLQRLDSPAAPGDKGSDHFVYDSTQEVFRKYRQSMLDVTLPQLQEVIEKYFKNESKHVGKCVLGAGSDDMKKRKGETWQIGGQQH